MRLASLVKRILPLGLAAALAGCAGAGPGASFEERDPYRETNESIHGFNVALDRNVLRPVSQGYDIVTPDLFQLMLGNAFSHLDTVNDFANYLLQGEATAAGTAFGRFTVNTVLGAGGLLDPATEFGLPKENTDLGVTLGKHGVPEGAFLMLPFFGPSTTRDLGGRVGDFALSPQTYIFQGFDSNALNFISPGYNAVEIVHDRNANADLIDEILYQSENSYISLRTVYLQRRDSLILGEDAAETLPDIFEDEPAN
jgi:phospholipid-binding lipoprotein MlaA